jgi:acetoin utilization deacetylase AcuC-like enzyme
VPIPVVYSDQHELHVPDGEIWVGIRIAGTELPNRGHVILDAVRRAGHEVVEPRPIGDEELEIVHTPALVEFLRSAYRRWEGSGYPHNPGQDRVVPYAYPLPAMFSGQGVPTPVSAGALTGMYAMDTMTLIGPGTWEAARAAASCAITAAEMVNEGEAAVYAAVRPPGHHAGSSYYGGSCYLNNAALAARRLLDLGHDQVAVIDLDAHHGNGTQQIFYDTERVRYGSVHIDPAEGYFPHWLGFAHEEGIGAGLGANRNLPLPSGTDDGEWLAAVERLVEFDAGVSAVVVSLGVDAWRHDPESPLQITVDGYHRAGRLIDAMALPTVIVQEGGYDLAALGDLVVGFLDGFGSGT